MNTATKAIIHDLIHIDNKWAGNQTFTTVINSDIIIDITKAVKTQNTNSLYFLGIIIC